MKVRTSRARTPLASDIELSRLHLLLMQKLKEVVTPCGPKILVHVLAISHVRQNSQWPDSRPWCPVGPLIQLSRLWMPQPPNSVHAFALVVVAKVICASECTAHFSAVPLMGPSAQIASSSFLGCWILPPSLCGHGCIPERLLWRPRSESLPPPPIFLVLT